MDEKEKIKQQTYEWTAKYARKKGFRLNPDSKMLDLVIEGITNNRIIHGKNYCPCRILTGDEAEDRKIICPCIYHLDEIENDGNCHCELFFK
jgi:ferredoxin-thioredoxin reductase catalytic subunit